MPLVEIEAKSSKTLTVRGLEACGWHAVGAVEFPHRVPVELESMVWYLLFKPLHHISQRLQRRETNPPFECRICATSWPNRGLTWVLTTPSRCSSWTHLPTSRNGTSHGDLLAQDPCSA